MGRNIAAVVCGFVAWWVVATLLNWLMRMGWPGYAEVEKAMDFTLAMMAGRLVVGALSSLGAGAVLGSIARRAGRVAVVGGLVLTAFFVVVHYYLWDKFPVWYHAVFLVSLLPLVVTGARLTTRQSAGGSPAWRVKSSVASAAAMTADRRGCS